MADPGSGPVLHPLHDLVADHLRGFCQNAVVDGEQCQLQTIRDAGFVVDATEIVLDHLFGGIEPDGDLLVFAALYDERDDLQLLGSEAIADAGPNRVFVDAWQVQADSADVALALTDMANAVDEGWSGHVTMGCTMDTGAEPRLDGLTVLGDDDRAAGRGGDSWNEYLWVEFERCRKEENC